MTITTTPATAPDPDALKAIAEQTLEDAKALDIVTIDLAGKTSIADHLIIASGTSTRAVAAMADRLIEGMKSAGAKAVNVEGLGQCDWVLIDAGDVVVHLFRPEVREFYNLEKMWLLDAPPGAVRGNAAAGPLRNRYDPSAAPVPANTQDDTGARASAQ